MRFAMNSGEPVLRLHRLSRQYASGGGVLDVLQGVDLSLRPGEFVGLIGPSGSGKSSLLHAAGLLERPSAGEVWIDGRECLGLPDKTRTAIRRARIGFVYQFHHLLPELSAVDNIVLPQRMAGVAPGPAREHAERLLDRMGLAARADHQPGQMSGGEQQRVAIARSLANKPGILLADEPTGNLDPATSEAVFQRLFDMVRSQKVAALVATHNHRLAGFMDRVLVLSGGKVREAAPDEFAV